MRLILTVIAVVILLITFIVDILDLYRVIKYDKPLIGFGISNLINIVALAVSFILVIVSKFF